MDLTVREALAYPCLEQAKVLAGEAGLDNIVRHVTVIDAPDAVEWLRGGEIVLTTAYHIKDDPRAQVRLIEALARKRAACLGIKLRRFLDRLSEDALSRADEERIPVVEIPFELAWIDIINPVLSDVMNRQTRLLEQSWEVHRRFLDVVLNGGNMRSVAATLARLVGRPVTIADASCRILAQEPADIPDDGTWPDVELTRQAIAASSGPNGAGDLGLLSGGPTLDAAFLETFRIARLDSGQEVLVAEIRAKRETYGYILVADSLGPTNGSAVAATPLRLSPTEIIAVQQAATVAALEIIKQRATEEVERRYQFNFVDDLLQGSVETQEAAIRRAGSYGWDFTWPHILLLLDIDGFEKYYLEHPTEPEKHMQRIKDRMLAAVRASSVEGAGPLIGVDRSDSMVVLAPVSPGTSAGDAKKIAVALGRALSERACENLAPLTVSVGIGRFYPDVLLLRRSYQEACEALRLGRRVWGGRSVVHYDDLGVYRLVLKCSDAAEMRSFLVEHLGSLIDYDRKHRTGLVRTLEVYLRTKCGLAETASRLFIHVNTLKYRLRRIEEISGMDLSDPEDLLNLNVAIRVKDVTEVTSRLT